MDHRPVAQYAAAVAKTFFVYAGTSGDPVTEKGKQPLRIMVSYYDHKTGTVPIPVILLEDLPLGAHGCPVLSMDDDGRLWVFISLLGVDRPGYILRSLRPYHIDAWEKVTEMEFRQPQVWHVPGKGFMLLHRRKADDQHQLQFSTSSDGLSWSVPQALATFGEAQSCMSGSHKGKVGVAFSVRVDRTDDFSNLYYMETSDFGKTWQVYPRSAVKLPLQSANNQALAYDLGNGWKFFLRDLQFDRMGNPIVLYILRHRRRIVTAPESRIWSTSRWIGREWEHTGTLYSDSDCDAGSMEVDRLTWYVTIPSRPGPQPNASGGEIVRWRSEDQGRSWYPQRLTHDSEFNHNWVRRPVNADPRFAWLWADGNPRSPSESRIWFSDEAGNVHVLPSIMNTETAKPELVWKAPEPATQPTDTQPSATQPASGQAEE